MKTCVNLLVIVVALSGTCLGCGCSKSMGPSKEWKSKEKMGEPAAGGQAGKDDQGRQVTDKIPRKIIYTATINMIVEDFAKADRDLIELVKVHKGYVINSEVTGSPG